ncbi:peptide chain release factor N(5)-glutamine methyltransferase [Hallella mizrahii]|uniref:peptide chain release factor N(5)-glutamine methyltransferase n=1 Tax=Hallella mizrahii TaxID=2606637 RepID=A0A7K0KH39_9BACT|nr:peptide chain release factor N(5)-glutamine methyltransferase [Hallella mizrahii]MST85218.1 peptide chain release factor N(5)-glutamine methyltransferase [Hallella mizrahii]
MTYQQLWHQLTPLYAVEEAQAITRLVLETTFGFSLTDLVCGKVSELSADDETKLHEIWQRLEAGEPVQYVLGEADFFGRSFRVAPGVLIPRPETEGLCRLVLDRLPTGAHVLDIGTGSGCIAITIALEATQALVEAWDISDEALRQAHDNALRLGAQVLFRQKDVLEEAKGNVLAKAGEGEGCEEVCLYDCIVSNPPYIADKERTTMARNVLDYEPSTALFVPDDDPLRFYRSIAELGLRRLRPDGRLCFEINSLYAEALSSLLISLGYEAVTIRDDDYGKQRFATARMRG